MTDKNSYFVDAEIRFNGRTYHLKKSTSDRWVDRGYYWHLKGSPSSWLCVESFRNLRSKFKSLPQDAVLKLLALGMEITVTKLINAIKWHEKYMRWHDGDHEYAVLEVVQDEDTP